jgi:hypothetical protein
MAIIDQIEKAQGQALDALVDSQKRALDLNERLADAVKGRVPAVKLPFQSVLPSPAEGIKLYFDFAGKLLATNRKFAESVISAWSQPEPKPAAKTTRTKAAA